MILTCTVQRTAKLHWILRRELRISDGLLRRLKPLNAFAVNGEASHTRRIVQPGDVVTVQIEEAPPNFPAGHRPIQIVYEDDALIVLDKPAGVIVHPTFNRMEQTLANDLLGYYQETGQKCAVHVLTRLDRDTMGLVIFAKNAYVHALLMEQLAAGEIQKTYLARTRGWLPQDEGRIDLPIARLAPGSLLRCVRDDGKPAVTEYRVLMRTLTRTGQLQTASAEEEAPCLLELCPRTGRTHQLRVHCSAVGHPIVGDPQYGGGEGGQRLVAKTLRFSHPLTGQALELHSAFAP